MRLLNSNTVKTINHDIENPSVNLNSVTLTSDSGIAFTNTSIQRNIRGADLHRQTLTTLIDDDYLSSQITRIPLVTEINPIATTLSYGSFAYDSPSDVYLCTTVSGVSLASGFDRDVNDIYYHTVTFIDDYFCTVTRKVDDTTLHWCVVGDTLSASTVSGDTFRYVYDEEGGICIATQETPARYISYESGIVLAAASRIEPANTIRMRPLINGTIEMPYRWVRYDSTFDNQTLTVDTKESENIKSNLLSRVVVDTDALSARVELLPLKTHLTSNHRVSKGGYFGDSAKFRVYTTLLESSRDEHIVPQQPGLTYTGYTSEVTAYPDTSTTFTTPADMYPFMQLNVNDSMLVDDGANGGDMPLNSDRIYYGQTSPITNVGVLLCAWLSSSHVPGESGIWVDRYYNPDRISQQRAYNILDVNYMESLTSNDAFSQFLSSNNYINLYDIYDKKSDLVFKPSTTYTYFRTGKKTAAVIEELYQPKLISNTASVVYDATHRVDVRETSAFSLYQRYATDAKYDFTNSDGQGSVGVVFDVISTEKPVATTLWSNYNDGGIELSNRLLFTPIIHAYTGTEVLTLNTSLNQLDAFIIPPDALTSGTPYVYQEQSNDPLYINGVTFTVNGDYSRYYSDNRLVAAGVGYYDVASVSAAFQKDVFIYYKSDKEEKGLSATATAVYRTYKAALDTIAPVEFAPIALLSATSIHGVTMDDNDNIYTLHSKTVSGDTRVGVTVVTEDGAWVNTVNMTSVLSGTPYAVDTVSDFLSGSVVEHLLIGVYNNTGCYIIKTDLQCNVVSRVKISSLAQPLYFTTHYKHQRHRYAPLPKNPLYVRVLADSSRTGIPTDIEAWVDFSSIAPGKHMIRFVVDSLKSQFTWYIDDKVIAEKELHVRDRDVFVKDMIFFGTKIHQSNEPLCRVTGVSTQGLPGRVDVSKYFAYSSTISVFDALLLFKSTFAENNFIFSLPCGQRNETEEVDSVCASSIPSFVSSKVDVNIFTHTPLNAKQRNFIRDAAAAAAEGTLPIMTGVNNVNVSTDA